MNTGRGEFDEKYTMLFEENILYLPNELRKI